MDPQKLLNIWEERWGSLSPRHRHILLHRNHAFLICRYSEEAIRRVVSSEKNLVKILASLRRGPWRQQKNQKPKKPVKLLPSASIPVLRDLGESNYDQESNPASSARPASKAERDSLRKLAQQSRWWD